MMLLLLWPIAGAAFVLWRWLALGRERASVAAYEQGMRQLEAAAHRAGDARRNANRRPSNPMPSGHVRVLPKETAVLRPVGRQGPGRTRRRSAAQGRRFGISA